MLRAKDSADVKSYLVPTEVGIYKVISVGFVIIILNHYRVVGNFMN